MKHFVILFIFCLLCFGDIMAQTGNTFYDPSNAGIGNTGSYNSGFGFNALNQNLGSSNTGVGYLALKDNSGTLNVGLGAGTLINNLGDENIGVGVSCLVSNIGEGNIGIGISTLRNNLLGQIPQSGDYNIGIGYFVLSEGNEGNHNIGIGYKALRFNTTGEVNIGIGFEALLSNTTGARNVAIGSNALRKNENGASNIGIGNDALYNNTTGIRNIAICSNALESNTTGETNIAIGFSALTSNISGSGNIAMGEYALRKTKSSNNIGIGNNALQDNTTGNGNTALGVSTLKDNTTGIGNTAIGVGTLQSNTTASSNTAVGAYALTFNEGRENAALGNGALYSNVSGFQNTAVGALADVYMDNLENATALGYNAIVKTSNAVRVGNTNVQYISGAVNFTATSDRRTKTNIKDSELGLDFIQKLRPVTYNKVEGHEGILYTGFIAQEVEEALNELDVEFSGLCKPQHEEDLYGLRYAEFVVPLVNAVQEQQSQIDGYKAIITDLEAANQALETRLDKLENLLLSNKQANSVNLESSYSNVSLNCIPNPFKNQTTIEYAVPENSSDAFIRIFNLEGKLMHTETLSYSKTGNFVLDSTILTQGNYICSLIIDGKVAKTISLTSLK